jgi:hypothetical protein
LLSARLYHSSAQSAVTCLLSSLLCVQVSSDRWLCEIEKANRRIFFFRLSHSNSKLIAFSQSFIDSTQLIPSQKYRNRWCHSLRALSSWRPQRSLIAACSKQYQNHSARFYAAESQSECLTSTEVPPWQREKASRRQYQVGMVRPDDELNFK